MAHTLLLVMAPLIFRAWLFARIAVLLALYVQQLPDAPQRQPPPPSTDQSPFSLPRQPQPPARPPTSTTQARVDKPWPREATFGDEKIVVYQPQLEAWEGDELRAYAAVSLQNKDGKKSKYGVVWFTARTEVDKVNRQVTLDAFHITKVQLPTMAEKASEYQALLQAKLPSATKVISLDRIEAALATVVAEQNSQDTGLPVKNDPPRIIFVTKPATLIVIDGPPQYKDVGGTQYTRVLNTRSIIVLDTKKNTYYLSLMDGWMASPDLTTGSWTYVSKTPNDLKEITTAIQERQQAKAPKGTTLPSLKQANKEGKIPTVYVSSTPTELLVTEGEPKFEGIPHTKLEFVKNTTANIFRDHATSEYYILLAGRWFRSKSLQNSPWQFCGGDLPEEFAKIPPDSPKAGVLASVPGTEQAQEALIANSIPQTATINRSEARLEVDYDGDPQFKAMEGTDLQYAVNTATPVIRVEHQYYAVENAVWFVAPNPNGPWVVATMVPAAIYSIPPSSPLHYVTYVKVYRSTPDVVYVGYTPGYYGTVVSKTTTTVVYGTGWYYPPYVGNYWYGAPYTYGVGVATTWSFDSGWSVTIGVGYATGYPYYYPWWGPWAYYPCCWGPAWGYGYGGYAAANVYGRWGNTAYAGTQAAWANPYTGNYGAGSRVAFENTQRGTVGVAGRGTNTNIYTGNTAGGRGAVGYNSATGIVAGAGAGYAGNVYSGEGVAGRGGFAYNTNTGAGVAAGANNVYAGKDGTVYRYDRGSGNWSQNSGNGWQSTDKPQPNLQKQQQARSLGQQRTQNFSGARAGGMRMGGGGRRR